ncbi:hypothetical protein AXG93_3825s1250 [Marchantia polymorpha subsp. ruderalis]|uniref:Uncharacterized protein n=1 Tax=Marchantia polymorpha subsp. ruderalis TaxID=1480154 RepID=A0A176WA53_MARPO|nr:hypothetical protein AXG93_3825s1250 [Marchantia polymorpha subsp. ruderalis]
MEEQLCPPEDQGRQIAHRTDRDRVSGMQRWIESRNGLANCPLSTQRRDPFVRSKVSVGAHTTKPSTMRAVTLAISSETLHSSGARGGNGALTRAGGRGWYGRCPEGVAGEQPRAVDWPDRRRSSAPGVRAGLLPVPRVHAKKTSVVGREGEERKKAKAESEGEEEEEEEERKGRAQILSVCSGKQREFGFVGRGRGGRGLGRSAVGRREGHGGEGCNLIDRVIVFARCFGPPLGSVWQKREEQRRERLRQRDGQTGDGKGRKEGAG